MLARAKWLADGCGCAFCAPLYPLAAFGWLLWLYILGGALSLNLPLRGVSSLYISSSFFSFLKIISMSTDLRHLTGYLLEPGAVGDRAVMKV